MSPLSMNATTVVDTLTNAPSLFSGDALKIIGGFLIFLLGIFSGILLHQKRYSKEK